MNTNNIEPGNYVGYLWMSDDPMPKCWKEPNSEIEKEINGLSIDQNPFIIEGMLYDAEREISYSIKYVDGEYIVRRWNLKEDFVGEDFDYSTITPLAHPRIGGHLVFHQYWHATEDTACLDMKVLKPYAQVFVGFNNKETEL